MAWLQRHYPVTVHLIEVDLSHAVLETTGACMKPDVSPADRSVPEVARHHVPQGLQIQPFWGFFCFVF